MSNKVFENIILPNIKRSLKNPIILTIIGILVTIIIFLLSQHSKKPTYAVCQPVLLAKASGFTPRLKILWDSTQITNALSTKIALWNDGREYIDAKDISITNPIRIYPSSKVNILSVALIATSRNDLKFNCSIQNDSLTKSDYIKVDLFGDEALEYLDGAELQLLYTCNSQVEFNIKGRIKGAIDGFKKTNWATSDLLSTRIFSIVTIAVATLMPFVCGVIMYKRKKDAGNNSLHDLLYGLFIYFILGIITIGYSIIDYLNMNPSWII